MPTDNDKKNLTEQEVISLLTYIGRHAPVPESTPEARSQALARAKCRLEIRRQKKQILIAVLAVAATVLVLVGPLYYREFAQQGVSLPRQGVAGATGGMASEIPPSLVARLLESDAARRQQDSMLTAAMAKDFDGRDNFVNAALAVYRHRARTAARLPNLLSRPADEKVEFNEAVLCYGVRLLAKTQQSNVPILPINGHRLAETIAQRGARDRESYYLAQDAVGQLCEALRSPEEYRLPEASRLAVLEYAANPERPLPERALREVSSPFGTAPMFLIVTVRVDEVASRSGRLTFLLLDSRGKSKPQSVEVPFYWSALPLPLFDTFPRPSQEVGNIKVSGGTGDEVVIAFTGEGGDARVFFSAAEGLPVAQRFPGGLVELCFEAKVEGGQGQHLPHIQFGSGGEAGVFLTATPPMEIGATWRQLSIPVSLEGADKWTNGIFVQVISLATGEKISVHVRNAYIRSVDSPQSGKQVRFQGRSGDENAQST